MTLLSLLPDDERAVLAITAKDRSNLYLTSQFLADPVRYQAFAAMYAVMRVIDDAVDDVADKELLRADQRDALLQGLEGWRQRITRAYAGEPADTPIDRALAFALQRFPVPVALWHNFVDAMRFDVEHPRFADFAAFLAYGEGATVAPTTIYVYLLCAQPDADGIYRCPAFDFTGCGRDLGLFAYLAHILRDVRVDALVGQRGLVYLSERDLQAHGLVDSDLRRFAARGEGDARFTALVQELVGRAQPYLERGRATAWQVLPALTPDCRFVLRLIVEYYAAMLARVAAPGVDLFDGRELFGPAIKQALVGRIASEQGFVLTAEHLLRMGAAMGG